MTRSSVRLLSCGAAILSAAALAGLPRWSAADADTKPVASPTTAPATAPTTAPATNPAGPATHVVKRGDLNLEVRAEAVFLPVDPFEVKANFKVYGGPLVVASAAPPGSLVRKDQLLLAFDRTHLDWAIQAADNELAVAKANLAKGLADAEVAAKSDPMALRQAEEGLKNAEAAKKWYDEVDGPQMLAMADLQAKAAQHGVDDRNDELEQLKKMYGAEELTAATADIVMRRSVRALELSKVAAKMETERRDKTKSFDYAINRQKVADAAESAKHQLALSKSLLEQTAVARSAGLAAARQAVDVATRKVAELKEDAAQFQFRAPSDGVLAYGNIVDGVWAGGDPKLFKVGEKLPAGQVLMRVYKPGKLRLTLALPESQAFWVEQGMQAKVTPAALPQVGYTVPTSAVEVQSRQNPPGIGWSVNVDLDAPDARLMPGMKATVVIDAGSVDDGLLVPLTALVGGKVKVKQKDGSFAERAVKVGKTDGTNVEVTAGLSEGDEVVVGKK